MKLKKVHLFGCFFCVTSFIYFSPAFVSAGLDKFTELDRFNDWLIERKVNSENNQIFCRASMPKYGTWFGSRIRLDKYGKLVIPEELKVFKLPKTFPMAKLKQSLKECHKSLIYTPQS